MRYGSPTYGRCADPAPPSTGRGASPVIARHYDSTTPSAPVQGPDSSESDRKERERIRPRRFRSAPKRLDANTWRPRHQTLLLVVHLGWSCRNAGINVSLPACDATHCLLLAVGTGPWEMKRPCFVHSSHPGL